jgi:hypothetical protein
LIIYQVIDGMKAVLNGVVLAKSYDIVTVEGNAYFLMDS